MRFWILTLAIYLSLHAIGAQALTSDSKQPATIEADEVEFDFRTGKRTYKGNVIVTQGTLKITGERMQIQYKDNVIQTATSWGNPATFKQRPDDKQEDVYGEGNTIILNDVEQTLTLMENAVMIQEGNTAKGNEIVYRMDEDKMTVKGLRETTQTGDDSGATKTESGRARVIIRPESKPKEATDTSEGKTTSATGTDAGTENEGTTENEEESGVQLSE